MEIATVDTTLSTGASISAMAEKVDALCEQVQTLTESHNRILALLESLESQIGPVIAGMQNGPIGKLMGL